ncbi:MAG: hypothetical protein ACJZ69_02635 [Pelagibacteraceae bacterium]
MIKKIVYPSIFISIGIFFYFILNHYFSENYIKEIKKNRLNYNFEINKKISDLEYLENDTDDVIEFNFGYNIENEKKIKRNFWELFNKK